MEQKIVSHAPFLRPKGGGIARSVDITVVPGDKK